MRYIISAALASTLATTAFAEVPRVVTDIPPVQSLVELVMGDLGEPVMLLDQGANAHDFQLKPSQVAALADAQLVVWIGPEMTPWLERALEGTTSDVAQIVLLDQPGTHTRSFAEADGDHTGDTDGDGDHHSGLDPHAWLDPSNAELWLGRIAGQLSLLDPEHAATYQSNANAAAQKIAELDARLKLQLAPIAGKPFVVFHDAYGYFAEHYGLTVAGTISTGDAAPPGVAHLRALQAGIGAANGLCLFPEMRHDSKLIEAMAADTGARLGGALDPEGAGSGVTADSYATILTGMAATLSACLSAP